MSRINIPDDIEVDYADLNVLIGNLIDNSIQAVMRAIQYDKPAYIDIELIYYAGNIVFRIKNSYIEVTEKKMRSIINIMAGESEVLRKY